MTIPITETICSGCEHDIRSHGSPTRGARFGLPGAFCGRCYGLLNKMQRLGRPLVIKPDGAPSVKQKRPPSRGLVHDPIAALESIPDLVTGERLSLAILYRTRRVFSGRASA